ncbi:hypothetical protein KUCAC02_031397 [Chaenocephalus aceratus]|nr:hypothetical protein KUCAC02_031397 [Chaenocephalus aceratus]
MPHGNRKHGGVNYVRTGRGVLKGIGAKRGGHTSTGGSRAHTQHASHILIIVRHLWKEFSITLVLFGLMLKHLGQTRDSDAVVENWFHSATKVILSSRLHRRAGDFLQQDFVAGRLKGVAIMKKTYAEDKRQSEGPETLPLSQGDMEEAK